MPPPYKTPTDAVTGLIEAYRTLDVEEIVRSKDFDMDARLFWAGLGIPIQPDQLKESRAAFETNFRKQLETKFPDYRTVSFRLVSEETPKDRWAIISVTGTTSDKKSFEMKLPVYHTDDGWKVVLYPGYDHL
jgi:hypothetical protein